MKLLWETELSQDMSRIPDIDIESSNAYFANIFCERKNARFSSLSLIDGTLRLSSKWNAWVISISCIDSLNKEIYVSGYRRKSSNSYILGVFDSSSLEIKKIYDKKIPASDFIEFDCNDNIILANRYSKRLTLLNRLNGTVKHIGRTKSVGGIFKLNNYSFLIPDYFDGKIYKLDSLNLNITEIFSGGPFYRSQIVGNTFYSSGVCYSYGDELLPFIISCLFPKQSARKRIETKDGFLFTPYETREFRITDLKQGTIKTHNINFKTGFFYRLLGFCTFDSFKVFKTKCLFICQNIIHIVELQNFKRIRTLEFGREYKVISIIPELNKLLILNTKTNHLRALELHID